MQLSLTVQVQSLSIIYIHNPGASLASKADSQISLKLCVHVCVCKYVRTR